MGYRYLFTFLRGNRTYIFISTTQDIEDLVPCIQALGWLLRLELSNGSKPSVQTKHAAPFEYHAALPFATRVGHKPVSDLTWEAQLHLGSSRDLHISSDWPLIKTQLRWAQRVAGICKSLLYQHEHLGQCRISRSFYEELHTLVRSLFSVLQ